MMLFGDRCLAVDLAQRVGSVLSHGFISAYAAVTITNSFHLFHFRSLARPPADFITRLQWLGCTQGIGHEWVSETEAADSLDSMSEFLDVHLHFLKTIFFFWRALGKFCKLGEKRSCDDDGAQTPAEELSVWAWPNILMSAPDKKWFLWLFRVAYFLHGIAYKITWKNMISLFVRLFVIRDDLDGRVTSSSWGSEVPNITFVQYYNIMHALCQNGERNQDVSH